MMRVGPFKFAARKLTANLVLAAFALRTLIPAGFMLAEGHPLTVVICPDGFPARLLSRNADTMSGVAGMRGTSAMAGMADTPGVGHHVPRGGPVPSHGDRQGGGHSQTEHCLFTSGSSHGPIPILTAPVSLARVFHRVTVAPRELPASVRLVYIPPPRAPPIPA